jgi:hypothetical protein
VYIFLHYSELDTSWIAPRARLMTDVRILAFLLPRVLDRYGHRYRLSFGIEFTRNAHLCKVGSAKNPLHYFALLALCRQPGNRPQIRPIGRPQPHGRRRCLHLLYPATAYYATNSWLSIEPPWCAMPTYAESTVYSARIRANIAIENTPFPSRSEHSAHFPPADLRRPASRSQGQRRWV